MRRPIGEVLWESDGNSQPIRCWRKMGRREVTQGCSLGVLEGGSYGRLRGLGRWSSHEPGCLAGGPFTYRQNLEGQSTYTNRLQAQGKPRTRQNLQGGFSVLHLPWVSLTVSFERLWKQTGWWVQTEIGGPGLRLFSWHRP